MVRSTKKISVQPVLRRSLVSEAIDRISSEVAAGTWKVGDRLPPEPELALSLGISRNTVREAVSVLCHADMLDVRQGDGTYVKLVVEPTQVFRRIRRSSTRDHLELQCLLESEAARYAARRRTGPDIKRLQALLAARGEGPGRNEKLEEFFNRDREFHLGVAAASHNAAIEELYRYFAMAVPAFSHVIVEDGGDFDTGYAAHKAIVDAIEAKDESAASAAARKLLQPRIDSLGQGT